MSKVSLTNNTHHVIRWSILWKAVNYIQICKEYQPWGHTGLSKIEATCKFIILLAIFFSVCSNFWNLKIALGVEALSSLQGKIIMRLSLVPSNFINLDWVNWTISIMNYVHLSTISTLMISIVSDMILSQSNFQRRQEVFRVCCITNNLESYYCVTTNVLEKALQRIYLQAATHLYNQMNLLPSLLPEEES